MILSLWSRWAARRRRREALSPPPPGERVIQMTYPPTGGVEFRLGETIYLTQEEMDEIRKKLREQGL